MLAKPKQASRGGGRRFWISLQLAAVVALGLVVYFHFKEKPPEEKKTMKEGVPIESERKKPIPGEKEPEEPEPKEAKVVKRDPPPPKPTEPANEGGGGKPEARPGGAVRGTEEAEAKELALVHRLVAEASAKGEAARRATMIRLKATGLRPWLDPAAHLEGKTPSGLDDAITAAFQTQKEGEEQSEAWLNVLRSSIRSAPVSPAARSRGMEFLEPVVRQESAAWGDVKLACQNVQSALPVMVAHLLRTRGTWTVQGGRAVFRRQADQTRYDEAAAALRKAATQWDRADQSLEAAAKLPALANGKK